MSDIDIGRAINARAVAGARLAEAYEHGTWLKDTESARRRALAADRAYAEAVRAEREAYEARL